MPARSHERTRRTGHIAAVLKLRRTRRHLLALICLLLLFVIYQLLSRRYDSGYAYSTTRTSKLAMEMSMGDGASSRHDVVYNLTSLSSNVTDTPSQSSASNTSNTTTSRRELIKPPLVTREMYQRIARMGRQALLAQTEDEDELILDDAYRYEFAFSQTNRRGGASSWPPVVSYTPEARIFPPSHVSFKFNNSTNATSSIIPSNSSSPLHPAPLTTPPHPQSQSQSHSQLPPYDPRYPPSLCASLPTGCRFLLPLSIAEQESKARTHILQLIHLAQRLNRTVVLPDVSMGRLGACRKRPFGWYYRSNISIEGGDDDMRVDTLEMNIFKRWLNSKFVRVQKGRIVTLDPAPPSPPSPPQPNATASSFPLGDPPPCSHPTLVNHTTLPLASLPGRSVYGTHKLSWCAARKFRKIDFDAYDPVVVRAHSEGCERGRNVGGEIGGVLEGMGMGMREGWVDDDEGEGEGKGEGQGEDGQGEDGHGEKGEGEVDVLAINWNLRRKIFYPTDSSSSIPPSPSPSLPSPSHDTSTPSSPLKTFGPPPRPVLHLDYSPPLHFLARKLAPAPGVRYVGVHWRMETVDEGVLERCAYSLLDKLRGVLSAREDLGTLRHGWFATDYPYSVLSPLPVHINISQLLASASSPASSQLQSQLQSQEEPQGPSASSTASGTPELGVKSTTFRDLGVGHHRAAQILRQAFSQDSSLVKEYGLRIWGLEQRIAALSQPSPNFTTTATNSFTTNLTALEIAYTNDTGALGILDKLVLVRSEVFLRGDEGCARKSSYTRQVEESRVGVGGAGVGGVERFGWEEEQEEGGNL